MSLPGRLHETLAEKIAQALDLCETALKEPEIGIACDLIDRSGHSPDELADTLIVHGKRGDIPAELTAHPAMGRALLLRCAPGMLARISEAPVEESVKYLLCKSANETAANTEPLSLSDNRFLSQCGIMRGVRFPAGQHQWEISGFPRRWISRVPLRDLPRTLDFILREAGGFRPWFETHLAPPSGGVPVFLEREFLAAFYRMARSLERQPGVKGIMAVSWMHSPETHRVSPHLSFMNRPFLEAKGLVTDVGPAPIDDGFLEGSQARAELYRLGRYHPTKAVALCSRLQAIAWAVAHPEAGELARKLI